MQAKVRVISTPALLFGVLLVCAAPTGAAAGVDVGVSINIGPPPIVVAEPPAVVLVPRTRVYFVPGVEFDLFFHNGYWWSPRGDRWYRAHAYNGPWRIVERRHVPTTVIRVPRDYRSAYGRERHIPYHEWRERHGKREHREIREHREREKHHEKGEHGRGRGHRD